MGGGVDCFWLCVFIRWIIKGCGVLEMGVMWFVFMRIKGMFIEEVIWERVLKFE